MGRFVSLVPRRVIASSVTGRWSRRATGSWIIWWCGRSRRRRCGRTRSIWRTSLGSSLTGRSGWTRWRRRTCSTIWTGRPQRRPGGGKVVALRRRGPAPATMNRRIAAVRGLFEHLVMTGVRADNPVPAARRASGLRGQRSGLLGHVAVRSRRAAGWCASRSGCRRACRPRTVTAFVADLDTHRDRAIVLAMVLGGLRAAEARSLRLADVDMGLRRVRVVGKGGKERVVPVDDVFFTECAAYLRAERPAGCRTAECFVVLHGPTRGRAMTEAGLRKVFRTHRARSGATRVRPHRLRHTYGTELAAAGIDLLVLRELMGHASPETTARYVHLSSDTLAAEFAAARAATGR